MLLAHLTKLPNERRRPPPKAKVEGALMIALLPILTSLRCRATLQWCCPACIAKKTCIHFSSPLGWGAPTRIGGLPPPNPLRKGFGGRQLPNPGGLGRGAPHPKGKRKSMSNTTQRPAKCMHQNQNVGVLILVSAYVGPKTYPKGSASKHGTRRTTSEPHR